MIKENFAERYNQTVDSILSDVDKTDEFLTILEEEKSILIIDGGMDEEEAEKRICKPENLRRAATFFMRQI